ncbi:hypothetical protein KA005_27795 [bacterium]|nr:hypothetical protein [bacterium]
MEKGKIRDVVTYVAKKFLTMWWEFKRVKRDGSIFFTWKINRGEGDVHTIISF